MTRTEEVLSIRGKYVRKTLGKSRVPLWKSMSGPALRLDCAQSLLSPCDGPPKAPPQTTKYQRMKASYSLQVELIAINAVFSLVAVISNVRFPFLIPESAGAHRLKQPRQMSLVMGMISILLISHLVVWTLFATRWFLQLWD